MGMDLCSQSKDDFLPLSWGAWQSLLRLAFEHGWRPRGTERPRWDWNEEYWTDDTWERGYFSNDGQLVTVEDALMGRKRPRCKEIFLRGKYLLGNSDRLRFGFCTQVQKSRFLQKWRGGFDLGPISLYSFYLDSAVLQQPTDCPQFPGTLQASGNQTAQPHHALSHCSHCTGYPMPMARTPWYPCSTSHHPHVTLCGP